MSKSDYTTVLALRPNQPCPAHMHSKVLCALPMFTPAVQEGLKRWLYNSRSFAA